MQTDEMSCQYGLVASAVCITAANSVLSSPPAMISSSILSPPGSHQGNMYFRLPTNVCHRYFNLEVGEPASNVEQQVGLQGEQRVCGGMSKPKQAETCREFPYWLV